MATPAARTPRPIRYRDTVEKNDSFLKTNSRSKRKLVNHRATGKCTISGWYKNGIQGILYTLRATSVTEVSRDCNLPRGPMGQGKGGASAASKGKIRLSPHQEVFVSDLYTFAPPPSSDAIEWSGTPTVGGCVVTRTKTPTAFH